MSLLLLFNNFFKPKKPPTSYSATTKPRTIYSRSTKPPTMYNRVAKPPTAYTGRTDGVTEVLAGSLTVQAGSLTIYANGYSTSMAPDVRTVPHTSYAPTEKPRTAYH